MRPFVLRFAVTMCVALAVGACATITNGTTQAINVDSDPSGAECTLMRGTTQLSTLTTPAPVTVKRDAQTIHVRCKKEGYEEALVVMNSRFETASAGNILLGGVIGAMVDSSSGANSKYDPSVMVRLTALSPADQASAAARAKIAAAAPAPAPVPEKTATAPAEIPAGPFDGVYSGGVTVVGGPTSGGAMTNGALRQIELSVRSGQAIGTVRHAQCANAGEIKLAVGSTGSVTGAADMLTGSTCGALPGTLEGRAEAGRLLLTVRYDNRATEFSLTRQ